MTFEKLAEHFNLKGLLQCMETETWMAIYKGGTYYCYNITENRFYTVG